MRRRLAANAEVVHRANKPLSEVMLPDAVHDDARDERASAMFGIGHPFSQRPPLLRGIRPATVGSGGGPIILRRFAFGQDRQEAQLDRLALRAEITASQQKCFARVDAETSKGIGGREPL